MSWRPVKGGEAEDQAQQWCQQQGWTLLGRNYQVKVGEIDLICRDKDTLVFIEVRQRSNERFGSASASITPAKQKKLIRAAQCYLQANPAETRHGARFDVLALDKNNTIHWIKGAFTA
jgi:putative endonuclease